MNKFETWNKTNFSWTMKTKEAGRHQQQKKKKQTGSVKSGTIFIHFTICEVYSMESKQV